MQKYAPVLIIDLVDKKIVFLNDDAEIYFELSESATTEESSILNVSFMPAIHAMMGANSIIGRVQHGEILFIIKKIDDELFLIEQDSSRIKENLDENHAQRSTLEAEKNASLSDIYSQISHELNTPLGICVTSISHLSEELTKLKQKFEKGTLTKVAMVDSLDILEKTARLTSSNIYRASSLVEKFRGLTKDRRKFTKEKINLNRFFAQCLDQLEPLISKKQVSVVNDIPDDLCVYESPNALSQIMTNLIVNSLRHGFAEERSNAPPRINLSAKIDTNRILVSYRDNGVGIPPQIRSYIFDPFFSSAREGGSTGLGLAIIKDIVEHELNGTVHLPESVDGFAITFSMGVRK